MICVTDLLSARWPELASATEDAGRRLEQVRSLVDIPGIALSVTAGGVRQRWSAGVAPDVSAPLAVASITKLVTATAVMRLVDAGEVGVDDPLTEHVPEYVPATPGHAEGVTVRRLLAHTSGIPAGAFEGATRSRAESATLAEHARSSALYEDGRPPGEVYSYSSTGYILLGRLVEVRTGQRWWDALRSLVVGPLGLESTYASTTEVPVDSRLYAGTRRPPWWAPSSELHSSLADLETFGSLFCANRPRHLTALLSDEASAAMRRSEATIPNEGQGVAGGLGWRLYNDAPVMGHWGCAERTATGIWIAPEEDVVVVVCAVTNDFLRDGHALYLAQTLLFGESFAGDVAYSQLDRGSPAAPAPQEDARRMTGSFGTPGARLDVYAEGENLCLQVRGVKPHPLQLFYGEPLVGGVVRRSADTTIARFRRIDREALLHFLVPGRDGAFRYANLGGYAASRLVDRHA